ncbi:two-component regulator propeller domain-containing protein [Rhodopirellula sp. SWK7]
MRSDAWGPDDGLPSDQVFDILQTQDGYLWLGTGSRR